MGAEGSCGGQESDLFDKIYKFDNGHEYIIPLPISMKPARSKHLYSYKLLQKCCRNGTELMEQSLCKCEFSAWKSEAG